MLKSKREKAIAAAFMGIGLVGIELTRYVFCAISKSKKNKKAAVIRNIRGEYVSPLKVYFDEVEIARSTIADADLEEFNHIINILDAFMCHCEESYCEEVLQTLTLALTTRNCTEGLNEAFPRVLLPEMFTEARRMLEEVLRTASPSNEFEKVALKASLSLMTILEGKGQKPQLRILTNNS